MNLKLALFDFDGTIIDSAEGITDSVLYALEKEGIHETDREKIRVFIGPPLFESFKKYYGADDEKALRLVNFYREFYGPTGHKRCSVYEGIPELLQSLKNRGIITAVASAKPENFVKNIVDEKNLSELFDFVKGITLENTSSDKTATLLEAIRLSGVTNPDEIVMIGDRCYDIDAGKKLGVNTVGVLYGFGDREELEASKADFIAEEVSDIYKFFE